MYQYISAIEIDCRHKIKEIELDFKDIEEKAVKRFKEDNGENILYSKDDLVDYLDFGDYIQVFKKNNLIFSGDRKKINDLCTLLESLVQTRNRVMHSRPLDSDDEDKIDNFLQKYERYSDLISFDSVHETIILINSNPAYFIEKHHLKENIYIPKDILHNLPIVDFDDTGFIGREEEKHILLKKIKGPYPVISVIGDGGIGKTSLVLSCLYEYISQDNLPYKRIIWVSLKTKTLQDGEFKIIKNSFNDFESSIKEIELNEEESNISILKKYMQLNPTLLVIDNLETINPVQIKDFLEDLPYGSKVIITSRIGIGEFENRFKLQNLKEKDAICYFRRLVKVYNVKALRTISDEKVKEYIQKMYYSPLCIKWFVINVGKGGSIPNLLFNNEQLIDYCLSNVFMKLSEEAKYLINILLYKVDSISPAEIIYIAQMEYDECMESINELIACNFLEQNELGLYALTSFSREYLRKRIGETCFDVKIQKNIRRLEFDMENLMMDKHLRDINRPLSLFPKNAEEKIATLYMLKFIECSKEHSISEDEKLKELEKLFKAAQQAAPSFADIYKVAAYLYFKYKKYDLTIQCYDIALECERDIFKKAMLKNHYASFIMNYEIGSIKIQKLLSDAMAILPTNPYVLCNFARYYKYKKEFDRAEFEYKKVLSDDNIEKNKRIIALAYSEIMNIKVRRIDMSIYNEQTVTRKEIMEVVEYLNTIPADSYSYGLCKSIYKFLSLLIKKPSLILKNELEKLIISSIKYVLYIKEELKDYFDFVKQAEDVLTEKFIENVLNKAYTFESIEYGKVISKKEDYFFISQQAWPKKGVYCNHRNYLGDISEIENGDYVEFTPYIYNGKRSAINVKAIRNLPDDEI